MLILASGDQALYEHLEPLKVLGRPKYFGPSVSAGAETKLLGNIWCSMAALASALGQRYTQNALPMV